MGIEEREKLLILLGCAQATISAHPNYMQIIHNTQKNYALIYERWLNADRQISPDLAGATRRWWVSAVRFKTLERLRGATAELSRSLQNGGQLQHDIHDEEAVCVGDVVTECLGILERNPAGRPGKRARLKDPTHP